MAETMLRKSAAPDSERDPGARGQKNNGIQDISFADFSLGMRKDEKIDRCNCVKRRSCICCACNFVCDLHREWEQWHCRLPTELLETTAACSRGSVGHQRASGIPRTRAKPPWAAPLFTIRTSRWKRTFAQGGMGAGVPVRVIRRAPDRLANCRQFTALFRSISRPGDASAESGAARDDTHWFAPPTPCRS